MTSIIEHYGDQATRDTHHLEGYFNTASATATATATATVTTAGINTTQVPTAATTGVLARTELQHDEENPDGNKYMFRPSTLGANLSFHASWLDEDESGSYDPSGKLKRLTPPPLPLPKPKRLRELQEGDEQNDTPKRSKTTWLTGRQHGNHLIVVLKATTEAGREALKKFPAFENAEEDSSDSDSDDSDDGRPSLWAASGGSFSKSFSSLSSYRLRSQRQKLSKGGVISSGGHLRDDINSRDHGIALGNPLARGCKGCLEIGQPCSLLNYKAKWPCASCAEDKMDCELIIPPTKKRTCEGCKRHGAKLACSYDLEEDGHEMPCKQCQFENTHCVAGPQTNRVRLPPDQDLTKFKETLEPFTTNPRRRYKACTPCRKEHVKCSIRKFIAKGPCGECKRLGQACTFEEWEHPSRVNHPSLKQRNTQTIQETKNTKLNLDLVTRPSVKTEEAMKSSLHREVIDLTGKTPNMLWSSQTNQTPAEVKTIKTCFAHPMTFNHFPRDACDFCKDITFGMRGYGERDVEVIDYKDGGGYHEVEGGYTGMNKEATRMCMVCSLGRIHIVNCHSHEILPIADLSQDDEAYQDMAYDIIETGAGADDCPIPWCAVCPAPAFYGCCAPQTHNMFDEKVTDYNSEEAFGCGLLLCETCAYTVRDNGGKLHGAVKVLQTKFEGWGGKLRADVQFLLSGDDTRQWHG
jgi:hypothetical protein